jgi:hypothetical protein
MELDLTGEDVYLLDHKVNGQTLFPGTGLVLCAWDALARSRSKPREFTAATITQMEILNATVLNKKGESLSVLVLFSHWGIVEGVV